MAGVRILTDDSQIRAGLGQLLGALADPAPMLREIGEGMLRHIDDRFRSETDPTGRRWPELSDVTLLRRLARRSGTLSKKRTRTGGRTLTKKGMALLGAARILRDTGRYQDSTFSYALQGATLLVGTSAIQGAAMHFGMLRSDYPHLWGDIPPRPVLGISGADETTIAEAARRHLGPLR